MVQCQSCGMPMSRPEDFADKNINSEYCLYCMRNGKFVGTREDIEKKMVSIFQQTMEIPKEEAKQKVIETLSTLKRWRKKEYRI